jgi:DNA mismatch endonuclease (patch repair protein)
MDTRTPEQRRRIMQSVGQKNTGPEMVVRRLAHRLGYRFRLHPSKLAGKPDLVFPARRKVIFVNGCFWHGHEGCRKGAMPKSRADYWAPKIAKNKERDAAAIAQLRQQGWKVLTVWQCQTRDLAALETLLGDFLESAIKIRSTF